MFKVPMSQFGQLLTDDIRRAKEMIRPAVLAAVQSQAPKIDAALAAVRGEGAGSPLQVTVQERGVMLASNAPPSISPAMLRLAGEVAEGLGSMDNIYHLVYGCAKRIGVSAPEVRGHFWAVVATAKYMASAPGRLEKSLADTEKADLNKVAEVFTKAFSER